MIKKRTSLIILNIFIIAALMMGIGTASVFADADQVSQTAAAGQTDSQSSQSTESKPSLLPGEFFYFIKVIAEKIELALTSDDVKKAQLLAEFAQERIHEANALFAEGKTDLAVETLQKSLDNQDRAMNYQTDAEAENAPESSDKPATVEDDSNSGSSPSINQELAAKFKQNIESLITVLAKIDNPKAKEALTRNIQKSFEKLAKTTKKLNEADEKYKEKSAEIETKLSSGQITEEEANREKLKLSEELSQKQNKLNEELSTKLAKIQNESANEAAKAADEVNQQAKEQRKEAGEQAREELKKAKEQAKEQRKKAHEQAKEQRKKAHEQAKEQREKAREQAKKEREQAKEKKDQ